MFAPNMYAYLFVCMFPRSFVRTDEKYFKPFYFRKNVLFFCFGFFSYNNKTNNKNTTHAKYIHEWSSVVTSRWSRHSRWRIDIIAVVSFILRFTFLLCAFYLLFIYYSSIQFISNDFSFFLLFFILFRFDFF